MSNSIVMLSGGPDSATAGAVTIHNGKAVEFVFIDYGHPGAYNELAASRKIAEHFGKPLWVININGMYKSFTDAQISPDGFEMGGCGDAYSPMLIAANFAVGRGANELIIGTHKSDLQHYPDTMAVFRAQGATIRAVRGTENFTYLFPLLDLDKASVMSRGISLGLEVSQTWSCTVSSSTIHCGVCSHCQRRRAALLGHSDTTRYAR